jgi:hypothetical protein
VRRTDVSGGVPERVRPNRARAAAAARLAGAGDSDDAVAERMRQAARRARMAGGPAAGRGRPTRPTRPETAGAAALAVVADPRPNRPAPEEAPRPRHLTVVQERGLSPAQRRRRARAALIAGVGAATMIGLALVYFHVVLAQRQFAIDHMDQQLQQAQSTYQQRRLEVAQLSSPGHIISTAEGQLGMIQPNKVTYLTPSSTSPPSSGTGLSDGATSGQAPAGNADWPHIKSQLAGIP